MYSPFLENFKVELIVASPAADKLTVVLEGSRK